MTRSQEIVALFDQYVMPTYGRYPLAFVRGQGSRVWDADGKEYLDFGGGIAVNVLGHAALTEILAKASAQLVHVSNLYYTEPQGRLAKKLVELVGTPGKVFFAIPAAKRTRRCSSWRGSLAMAGMKLLPS